jgi:hypothetical protein
MKKNITIRPFPFPVHTLATMLLLLQMFAANGQTKWTQLYMTPQQQLFDVAYGSGKYVAVGANSKIYTSTDSETWEIQQTELNEYGTLSSIVYANNQFIAVGGPGVIVTSPDGKYWTNRVSGTANLLQSIAYGNGTYVVVGSIGALLTSTDGEHWTQQQTGQEYLHDVAFMNGLFVAVGSSGVIKTSSNNGVTWTTRGSGTNKELRAVTAGKYGSFVAVGDYGTIVQSNSGIDWNVMTVADKTTFFSAVACNPTSGWFVAVSSNKQTTLNSPNGLIWGNSAVSTGSNQVFYGVRFVQNSFLAVGSNGTIRTSYNNGASWKSGTDYRNMSLNGSAYGNGYFVVVGNAPVGTVTPTSAQRSVALVSNGGTDFAVGETVNLIGGGKFIHDVAYGDGLFIAVGADALIQTSTNGKNWSFVQVEFGKTLRSITYGNGKFVAVGDNGLILYSKYGKYWSKSTSAAIYSYNKVKFANGMFVLVGPSGVLATSTDGNFWMYRYTGTKNNLRGVAYGNGKWIAVGMNRTMVTSQNGLQWSTVSSSTGVDFVGYTDIVYGYNKFVITGLGGKIYRYVPNVLWDSPPVSATNNLNTLTYANGRYVAAGDGGNLFFSYDDSYFYNPAPALANENCGNCIAETDKQIPGEKENTNIAFSALTYPNPVIDRLSLKIEGAAGQNVRIQLMDISSRTILDKVVEVESPAYQEEIQLAQREAGIYILRVSTATETRTLKVLKR